MTLKTARGTLALLELEDSAPDVLFARLPGATAPLWPDVRSGFMYAMQEHDFGSTPLEPAPTARLQAWLRLGRALLPSRWDARRVRSQRSAVFLVSGVTVHRNDGKLRNWLVSDFVDQFPGVSAVLQWGDVGSPEPAFPLTRTLDPMVTRAAGYARLSPRRVDPRSVHRLIREFAARLDERITGEQIDAIASSAVYSASISAHVESQFSRVLDRLSPRVAVMEDASYGGRAALVTIMKARGILIAEPQHGWIGPTHGAYNFGAAMHEPELFATLPDELLTFGEYWSEGLRHPARLIAIGKPHLEAMSSHAPSWHEREREVLLVSSVADPAEMTKFGLALRSALPKEWRIRFRPHPSERASVESRYGGMLRDPGIVLDEYSDVYESLAAARGVVGVASTVLFEALEMGCRVFVKESPYSEYYTGELFGPRVEDASGIRRIARMLIHNESWESRRAPEEIWKRRSAENFRLWMESRLHGLG